MGLTSGFLFSVLVVYFLDFFLRGSQNVLCLALFLLLGLHDVLVELKMRGQYQSPELLHLFNDMGTGPADDRRPSGRFMELKEKFSVS